MLFALRSMLYALYHQPVYKIRLSCPIHVRYREGLEL